MYIVVPRERSPGERRVALVPEAVAKLASQEHRVGIEEGAGEAAQVPDSAFAMAGAQLVSDPAPLLAEADIVLKIQGPQDDEMGALRAGSTLVGLLQPLSFPERMAAIAQRGVTAFSLDLKPRRENRSEPRSGLLVRPPRGRDPGRSSTESV